MTKIGILHRITKALGELGLDIRHATVQTMGIEVVDTFYVRTRAGDLLSRVRRIARRSRRLSCTPLPDRAVPCDRGELFADRCSCVELS